MTFTIGILLFAALLSLYLLLFVVAILHEFGHYLLMRIFGAGVYLAQIGLGPVLFQTKRGVTNFVIRAIPLGGASGDPWGLDDFVKPLDKTTCLFIKRVGKGPAEAGLRAGDVLRGVGDSASPSVYDLVKTIKRRAGDLLEFLLCRDGKNIKVEYRIPPEGEIDWTLVLETQPTELPQPEELNPELIRELLDPLKQKFLENPARLRSQMPAWKNFLITFAGPFANYSTAVLVIVFWLLIVGQRTAHETTTVGLVLKHSPSENAGLEGGDKLLSVDDRPIEDTAQLQSRILASQGAEMRFELLRGDEFRQLSIKPRKRFFEYINGQSEERYMIGVLPLYRMETLGLKDSVFEGIYWPFTFLEEEFRRIWYLNSLPRREVHHPPIEDRIRRLFHKAVFLAPLVFAGISVLFSVVYLLLPHPAGDGYRLAAMLVSRTQVLSQSARKAVGISVQALLFVFLAATVYQALGETRSRGSKEPSEGFQVPAREAFMGIVPTKELLPPL